MLYNKRISLRDGRTCVLRNGDAQDGQALFDNFMLTHAQTDWLLSYPDENFELDQYLRSLHFNYDYLRKLFKREVGVTPHQFLVDTRLQAAAERLASPDGQGINISEVAHLCGFREPLYFSKIFRKKYGLSPSQFQLRLREADVSFLDGESIKIRALPDA